MDTTKKQAIKHIHQQLKDINTVYRVAERENFHLPMDIEKKLYNTRQRCKTKLRELTSSN